MSLILPNIIAFSLYAPTRIHVIPEANVRSHLDVGDGRNKDKGTFFQKPGMNFKQKFLAQLQTELPTCIT